MSDAKMVVIYDGECPFCRSYVSLMALRDRVGQVDLVDARSNDPRVINVRERLRPQRGHDCCLWWQDLLR